MALLRLRRCFNTVRESPWPFGVFLRVSSLSLSELGLALTLRAWFNRGSGER